MRVAVLAILLVVTFCIGCSTVSEVNLNNSLGLIVFKNMGFIKQHNVNLGICVDDKIKNLVLDKKRGEITFKYNVGDTLTVKLIKALSYNFNGLQVLEKNAFPEDSQLDAIIFVELQDIDMSNKYKAGFAAVTAASEGRISIKGSIKDKQGKIIWVGTAKEEGKGSKACYGAMYGATGEEQAAGMDEAIELVVSSLVKQMILSDNLRSNIVNWENQRR